MNQDRIMRKIDRDPTAEEMSPELIKAYRSLLATGRYSPMARKGVRVELELPDLIEEYCKNIAKAHSKYCHTAKIKVQFNLYLTHRGRFVSLPEADYKLPPEAQNIDQRTRKDQHKRWDIDWAERRHWRWVMKNAKKGRFTSKQREFIQEIDKKRKKLDQMGIPNYVVTLYKRDWIKVNGFSLMVFPSRGRSGPFTMEKDDGVGVEVKAWLDLVKHLDHWTIREMFIDAGYFIPGGASRLQVRRHFPNCPPLKGPRIAKETDEDEGVDKGVDKGMDVDVDVDLNVDDQAENKLWTTSPGSVDAQMKRIFANVEKLPEVPIPENDDDPVYDTEEEDAITEAERLSMGGPKLPRVSTQKEYPEVDWEPRPRPAAAQKLYQASDCRWKARQRWGFGHYVSLCQVQRQSDYDVLA